MGATVTPVIAGSRLRGYARAMEWLQAAKVVPRFPTPLHLIG
jgi:hypothetical protein